LGVARKVDGLSTDAPRKTALKPARAVSENPNRAKSSQIGAESSKIPAKKIKGINFDFLVRIEPFQ
jgi:hypothetical protein